MPPTEDRNGPERISRRQHGFVQEGAQAQVDEGKGDAETKFLRLTLPAHWTAPERCGGCGARCVSQTGAAGARLQFGPINRG